MTRLTGRNDTAIAADVAGEGPPLLLVHGTSSDRARWAPLLPHLTGHFTAYAIDRRGRGDSGDEPDYDIRHEFEDMAALVGEIAERHSQPVHLFGHSYGAFCLLEASRLTDRIARAVLYEPPLPLGAPLVEPATLAILEQAALDGDRDLILETFAMQVVRYPPEEFEMIKTLPTWRNRQNAARTIPRELAALNRYPAYDVRRFAGYDRPTLLLLGSDSPGFLQQATHRLHDSLPVTALHVMAGQQHNAIDAIPAEVGRLTIDFLQN
jgi:pimeloyl-ACP methyl ester carboxylesterase